MKSLTQVVEHPSGFDSRANYIGQSDFPEWDCLLTQNRDSDCLTRSNFRSALKELGGECEAVQIHRFNHWACCWWEVLAVRQGTDEHKIAMQIESRISDYPVVDEQDFSELETSEANDAWRDWGQDRLSRPRRIGANRNGDDRGDRTTILACRLGRLR